LAFGKGLGSIASTAGFMGLVQPEQGLGASPRQHDRESGIRLAFGFSDAAKKGHGFHSVCSEACRPYHHIAPGPQREGQCDPPSSKLRCAALLNVQQMCQRVDAMPAWQSRP